jgi:hypothetical protein
MWTSAYERGKIMNKRFLAIYLCLLAVAAIAVAADIPAFFAAGPSCASSSAPLFTQPQPGNRDSCFQGPYCDTNQDCENRCSGYATATCIENDCYYTYGSPGGGTGGGGYHSSCFSTPCDTYAQCTCLRPDGIYDYGQCIQNLCIY